MIVFRCWESGEGKGPEQGKEYGVDTINYLFFRDNTCSTSGGSGVSAARAVTTVSFLP